MRGTKDLNCDNFCKNKDGCRAVPVTIVTGSHKIVTGSHNCDSNRSKFSKKIAIFFCQIFKKRKKIKSFCDWESQIVIGSHKIVTGSHNCDSNRSKFSKKIAIFFCQIFKKRKKIKSFCDWESQNCDWNRPPPIKISYLQLYQSTL